MLQPATARNYLPSKRHRHAFSMKIDLHRGDDTTEIYPPKLELDAPWALDVGTAELV